MIDGPSIRVPLELALEPRKVNAVLAQMKKALGPLGKEIQPIDAKALNAELAKIEAELVDVDQKFQQTFSAGSVDEMKGALADLLADLDKLGDDGGGKSSFTDRFFKASAIAEGADFLGELADRSNDTRQALRQLGAQTGITGSELERLKGVAGDVYNGVGLNQWPRPLGQPPLQHSSCGNF